MPNRLERRLDRTIFVVLFAASLALNLLTALQVPRYVGGHVGIAVVIAFVGNLGLGLLGAWGTRRLGGAIWPATGWFVAFGTVTFFHPGEDVILAGSLQGDHSVVVASTFWVLAGLLAAVISIAAAVLWQVRGQHPVQQLVESPSKAGTTPSG